MDTVVLVMYIIISVFALGLGFGLTFWILGTIIDKTNNIGDSQGTSDDYKAFIRFSCRKDKLSHKEEKDFISTYFVKNEDSSSGPEGSDPVRRLSGEELAEYEDATAEDAAAKREAMLKGPGKNHHQWDSNDLSGVFRPLKEE